MQSFPVVRVSKSLFISLPLAVKVFLRLEVRSFPFSYVRTESHKYDDAELIDINLCQNNVDI